MMRSTFAGFSFTLTMVIAMTLSLAPAGASEAFAKSFPHAPRPEMTPGSLCESGSTSRYPQHIRYCSRSVDSRLKNEIIRDYDQEFGYGVRAMPRGDFKIDHYIPLCAGGSNDRDNLWPQHKSVYSITDPLEQVLCEKMATGRLKQADAINLIREAKNNLPQAPVILQQIRSL